MGSLNSSFQMFVELINIIKRLDFFQSFAFNIVNLFYSASTKASTVCDRLSFLT